MLIGVAVNVVFQSLPWESICQAGAYPAIENIHLSWQSERLEFPKEIKKEPENVDRFSILKRFRCPSERQSDRHTDADRHIRRDRDR